MNEILAKLYNLYSSITGMPPESVRPETDIRGLKFAQLATFVMACEKHFRIRIRDEWAVEFTCIQDAASLIQREIADGTADYAPPTDESRIAWYYETRKNK